MAKKRQRAKTESHYRSLVDIGIALSAEKDLGRILDVIIDKAITTTSASAASVYLTENVRIDSIGNTQKKFHPVLRFQRRAHRNGDHTIPNIVLPLDSTSLAGYVALSGQPLRLWDCAHLPAYAPYEFNPDFDGVHNEEAVSILCVPMTNAEGKVRGVLSLLNKTEGKTVTRFTAEDTEMMKVFASQACVAIENAKLTEDIENLFESFIRASVTAIESRDPTTSGHSDRVAVLTVEFARAVHRSSEGPYRGLQFSDQQMRELRYAALLHDFGKIGVRESILQKELKLYPHELKVILARLDTASFKQEMKLWQEAAEELAHSILQSQKLDPAIILQKTQNNITHYRSQLQAIREGIIRADQPEVMAEDFNIQELIQWIDTTSTKLGQVILMPEERVRLSLPKGGLDENERSEIESHVSHTYHFLNQIAWTEDLSHVADIAHAHHEKCDGSGYPCGLKAAQIPVQSKMMAIADIYDALTAMDRPYKRAVSIERALDILLYEVQHGKLDGDLLKIFIESQIFRSSDGMSKRRAG